MKNRVFLPIRILGISLLLSVSLCASACAATFKGRIIDADTKQPLEGVVVVATWSEETTSLGATHTRLKDVKEVLTNKNGEWEIHGPRGMDSEFMENIMAFLGVLTGVYYTRPPEIIYFKPGYCSFPAGYGISECKTKIKFGNDILELPKLMNRSREILSRNIPFVTSDASDKTPIFHMLWDQDFGYE